MHNNSFTANLSLHDRQRHSCVRIYRRMRRNAKLQRSINGAHTFSRVRTAVQYSGAFCPASSGGLPATDLGAPIEGLPTSLDIGWLLLTCCPVGGVASGV